MAASSTRIGALALLLLWTACSSRERMPASDAGPPARDGGAPDAGRPADVGPPPPTDSLTVRVLEGPTDARTPVEGATVLVLTDDARRLERPTDADGVATFEGIDLTAGVEVTTEGGPDRSMVSYLAVDRARLADFGARDLVDDAGRLQVFLGRLTPRERVELSGVATMSDVTHNLAVFSTVPGALVHDRAGASFRVEVPPGEAGTLIAFEYATRAPLSERGIAREVFAWQTVDYDAPAAAATVELDLTTAPVEAETFSGSFTIPAGDSDFFGVATGSVFLRTRDSGNSALVALLTMSEPSPEGRRFMYEGQRIDPPDGSAVVTDYLLVDTPRISRSFLQGDHIAVERDPEFLEPAEITTPAFGMSVFLENAVAFTTPDDDAYRLYQIERDDVVVWTVWGPPGTSSIAAPGVIPSTVDRGERFGGTLDGRVLTCDFVNPEQFCRRFAVGRSFELVP